MFEHTLARSQVKDLGSTFRSKGQNQNAHVLVEPNIFVQWMLSCEFIHQNVYVCLPSKYPQSLKEQLNVMGAIKNI